VCFPVEFVGKGAGYRGAVLLQVRYVRLILLRSVYVIIKGGPVELNNSDCAKCR